MSPSLEKHSDYCNSDHKQARKKCDELLGVNHGRSTKKIQFENSKQVKSTQKWQGSCWQALQSISRPKGTRHYSSAEKSGRGWSSREGANFKLRSCCQNFSRAEDVLEKDNFFLFVKTTKTAKSICVTWSEFEGCLVFFMDSCQVINSSQILAFTCQANADFWPSVAGMENFWRNFRKQSKLSYQSEKYLSAFELGLKLTGSISIGL